MITRVGPDRLALRRDAVKFHVLGVALFGITAYGYQKIPNPKTQNPNSKSKRARMGYLLARGYGSRIDREEL